MRVEGFGSRVQDLPILDHDDSRPLSDKVVSGEAMAHGLGLGFRVQGLGFRVQGLGFRF